MNKRQRKKNLNKHGYKNFYKRASKCKSYSHWFKLIYPNHLIKNLIYKENPFLKIKNHGFPSGKYVPIKDNIVSFNNAT